MKKELLIVLVSVALSVGVSALVLKAPSSSTLGGLVHLSAEDFTEGIKVDGTTVIEGDGDIVSTDGVFSSTLVGGASAASGSFVGQFANGTATTSLLFSGNSTDKGTCFKMRNTAGTWVYARVFGTTFTVSTTKCY